MSKADVAMIISPVVAAVMAGRLVAYAKMFFGAVAR